MSKLSSVSGFLLAYNEEENIERGVMSLRKELGKVARKSEVMVVLWDGSTDRTRQIVEGLHRKHPNVILIIQPKGRPGYGNAVKIGISSSRYDFIFFSDGDNQFDMKDIPKLVAHIGDHDIVNGQRWDRKDPWIRVEIARTYNGLLRFFFPLRTRDVDCAFKLFRKKVFKGMRFVCSTGMVNAEIFIRARRNGMRIKEIRVPHYRRFAGRPVFETEKWSIIKPKVVIDLLKEMAKLWWDLHTTGRR